MRTTFLSGATVAVVTGFLIFTPQITRAARVSFTEVSNTGGAAATIVEVRIDPESKLVNVIEGELRLDGAPTDNLSVQVETEGSALVLWPTPPEYHPSEKAIHFTGGVPHGFDQEGLLFRLKLHASTSGDVTISLVLGAAYLNDGKGTREEISPTSSVVRLDADHPVRKTSEWLAGGITIVLLIVVLIYFAFRHGHKK